MPRDGKPNHSSEPDHRRSNASRRGTGPSRQRGFVERATSQGHSGYGSESVRPHLRDQLKLKQLLPQPFPTQDILVEGPTKDDHHQ
jgi:hypothetical protein